MIDPCETGMLFVRCKDGVSHRPDESISAVDAAAAIDVIGTFIETFDAAAFRR
ncbi:M20 family metallo-hydrolase [Varunaivibrio sulfuroxidans]|uniref:Peptidase M20/M25/M40-like protein n=1 Tax=Varunaivibrio sulfuroxidans TaxID=1773489 RepID=A0A4R3JC96_9PROT|nr:M20 family metallo-hydrolase [Varunaivibrio sulfuroxidans]TCS62975.1 hypothetical protein EDD55_10466 [Varunaivibrio sulfuroxidans]WES31947.1 M20 family metallo-hydrolase [Varunaivibrio sulfuroxidans]